MKYFLTTLTFSLLFIGCNNSSDYDSNAYTSSTTELSTITGKSIDGYLLGATVCLDLSKDGECQSDEPTTTTNTTTGTFSLTLTQEQQNNSNYKTALFIVYGGVDKDNPTEKFEGKLFLTNNLKNEISITPISSLVAHGTTSMTQDEALLKTATRLGITNKEDILEDPLVLANNGNRELLEINLQVQKAFDIFKSANKELDEQTFFQILANNIRTDGIGVETLVSSLTQTQLESAFEVRELAQTAVHNVEVTFENSQEKTLVDIVNILRVQEKQIIKEVEDGNISESTANELRLDRSTFLDVDYKEEMTYLILEEGYSRSNTTFDKDKMDITTLKYKIGFEMTYIQLQEVLSQDSNIDKDTQNLFTLLSQTSDDDITSQTQDCSVVITNDNGYEDTLPLNDKVWYSMSYDVDEIQSAFNSARDSDPTISKTLQMPTQSIWNTLSESQKLLFLLNKERVDRGIKPFEGIDTSLENLAQTYTQMLYDNNATGHNFDANPKERLSTIEKIAENQDTMEYVENIFISNTMQAQEEPAALAVYNWIYADNKNHWEDRKLCLINSLNDNSGEDSQEGLIGLGIVHGDEFEPLEGNVTLVVLDAFDPGEGWSHIGTQTVSSCLAENITRLVNNTEKKVIEDSIHNLMWQNELLPIESEYRYALNAQEAKEKCEYMDSDVFVFTNYSDWRLPTSEELSTFYSGVLLEGILPVMQLENSKQDLSTDSIVRENSVYPFRCVRNMRRESDLQLLSNVDVATSDVEVELQGKADAKIYVSEISTTNAVNTINATQKVTITLPINGEDGEKIFHVIQKDAEVEIGEPLIIKIRKDTEIQTLQPTLNLQENTSSQAVLPGGKLETTSVTPTLIVKSSVVDEIWEFGSVLEIQIDTQIYTTSTHDENGKYVFNITEPLEKRTYDVTVNIYDYVKNARGRSFTLEVK